MMTNVFFFMSFFSLYFFFFVCTLLWWFSFLAEEYCGGSGDELFFCYIRKAIKKVDAELKHWRLNIRNWVHISHQKTPQANRK